MEEDNLKGSLDARVRAFLEEFPFIKQYVGNIRWFSQRPIVKRVTLDLLDEDAWALHSAPHYKEDTSSKRIILLTKDGRQMAEVRPARKLPFNIRDLRTWSTKSVRGETVSEAITSLSRDYSEEELDLLAYILVINDEYGRDDPKTAESHFLKHEFGLSLVLYKAPTGRTFSQWIREIDEVAKEELEEDLKKVNTV